MNKLKEFSAKLLSRRSTKEISQPLIPTGHVPITEFLKEDIFITGYPKSGNTWFQDIAACLAFGALPEFAPLDLIQDLIPDVHAISHYKRYATPMFFKSHALPTPDYKRVVYLLRDGRDAMVSYYHQLVDLQNINVDFLEAVQTGRYFFPCKWHEHVEAWLANPFDAKMIVIKYRDLKSNTVRELRRFCDFVGLERSSDFLKMVAEQTTFEKMRGREVKWRRNDPQWPKDKTFRRRGMVGSHKDEMPPDVMKAFLDEAGGTLKRCGYI